MRTLDVYGKYFCGNEISTYGQEHNRVDYATFAKAFDAVLNNDIMNKTYDIGYWEPINGGEYYEDTNGDIYTYSEKEDRLEELEARKEELEETIQDIEDRLEEAAEAGIIQELKRDLDGTENELAKINEDIEALEEMHEEEVYQWYIVDNNGAELCEDAGEVLYYNEELDIYLWGVTHWGTGWDYVLTNIKCNTGENA